MVTLVVQSGPSEARQLVVEGEAVLGREDADIAIDDEQISRRHARVRPTAGGLEVEDLGSTNGTFVNGARIDTVTVARDGAVVGTTRLVVQAPDAGPSATVEASAP